MNILLQGSCPERYDAESKVISRQLKNLKYAPTTLRMASDLIDLTKKTTDLEEGLGSELSKLTDIFLPKMLLKGYPH